MRLGLVFLVGCECSPFHQSGRPVGRKELSRATDHRRTSVVADATISQGNLETWDESISQSVIPQGPVCSATLFLICRSAAPVAAQMAPPPHRRDPGFPPYVVADPGLHQDGPAALPESHQFDNMNESI